LRVLALSILDLKYQTSIGSKIFFKFSCIDLPNSLFSTISNSGFDSSVTTSTSVSIAAVAGDFIVGVGGGISGEFGSSVSGISGVGSGVISSSES